MDTLSSMANAFLNDYMTRWSNIRLYDVLAFYIIVCVLLPRWVERIKKYMKAKKSNASVKNKADMPTPGAKKTFLINFISGPAVGKSLMSAALYVDLKRKNYVAEYVQEVAKKLVWTKNFRILNNQYTISELQYMAIKDLLGEVDFIITDGPLVHGLYYNAYNKQNVSSKKKTREAIHQWMAEFHNINIFLERGDYPYETYGRYQKESEAKEIDTILKNILDENNIPYLSIQSDIDNIPKIIEYIQSYLK